MSLIRDFTSLLFVLTIDLIEKYNTQLHQPGGEAEETVE
ncbi:hypothetical protein D1BOALGB6SA_4209 [Olavius sp. associated proteobacterium Delta 1]|nr:hypothetical protein D1BOALGB6SA_4209 [Olavius sp. associated proteobacterium Delta 1]